MREPSPRTMQGAAERSGRRAARWVLAVATVAGAGLVLRLPFVMGAPGARAGGERLGPDAAVVRGPARLAGIQRVARARGRGRLPLYLAPASGPAIDSARVGALAARLVPGSGAGDAPVIALVPRDSVAGLAPVGRLVVSPGEPGLLVFGTAASGP